MLLAQALGEYAVVSGLVAAIGDAARILEYQFFEHRSTIFLGLGAAFVVWMLFLRR